MPEWCGWVAVLISQPLTTLTHGLTPASGASSLESA
jgi:hypothetical protein